MIQINERSILSTVIFLFVATLMVQSIGMRTDVVLVPRLVGTILLLLSGLQMINDLFPGIRSKLSFLNKKVDGNQTIGGEGVVDDQEESQVEKKERWILIGWMVLFVLLINLTSMIFSIAIAMFIYLKWISKESWLLSIVYPVITAVSIYLAFVVGLEVHYFW